MTHNNDSQHNAPEEMTHCSVLDLVVAVVCSVSILTDAETESRPHNGETPTLRWAVFFRDEKVCYNLSRVQIHLAFMRFRRFLEALRIVFGPATRSVVEKQSVPPVPILEGFRMSRG